ncbi:GNAT family N-acetyltransferase [Lewinella sp. W8]|uniref:GNAT family N-acetyltransferase n=1 Tax=Lewinella sp. W8 TaxID=2528208 RepID=UPI0015646531|nr:GNAT family N-acetyltransferase [Lewinella sp. W8]
MPTLIHHPATPLQPSELDRYLFAGWRPTGQSIYTSDFLRTEDDELRGCIQLRLPLAGHQFRKSHRKLLRRNGARFRWTTAPAGAPDEAMLEVNRRYMVVHPTKTREDIAYHITGEFDRKVLPTHVLKVFDGDQLVAFSFYDLGENITYSKAGIYDPAYARHSLGIYTMLLEVQQAMDREDQYYYPGYFAPAYPLFDYKIELGKMEYRDILSGRWLLLPDNRGDYPEDPKAANQRALENMAEALRENGIAVRYREYPSFTGRFRYPQDGGGMVDAPMLLVLGRRLPLGRFRIITYENHTGQYRYSIVGGANLYDVKVRQISQDGVPRFTTPVRELRVLAHHPSVSEIIGAVKGWGLPESGVGVKNEQQDQ